MQHFSQYKNTSFKEAIENLCRKLVEKKTKNVSFAAKYASSRAFKPYSDW